MNAYFVIYEGSAHDPDEWLRYYIEDHVPLVWRFPRIRGIDVHRGTGDVFVMTRLLFDNVGDLEAAITSSERKAARADMNNNLLTRFDGQVRHYSTTVIDLPPRLDAG